jgi:1-acyl-sn-glycerol-3-phosphate acyltransferase
LKWYAVLLNQTFKGPLWVWFKSCYRLHVEHAERCPRRGGLLVVANHQSFLDPPLLGVALPRVLNYTPRATLKKSLVYRALTAGLDLEHVDRDGRDVGAARRMIARLKGGEAIALFPEQTRTLDGFLGRITPGFHMLAAHAGVPVLPVLIEGSFDAWPRGRKRPKLRGAIRVRVGEPMEVKDLDRNEAARRVERALIELGARVRPAAAEVERTAPRTGAS